MKCTDMRPMKRTDMWLANDVLRWTAALEGDIGRHAEKQRRAYEIWEHANSVLNGQYNDFYLIDAIGTLKRAVNHRLRQLDLLYPFRQLFEGQNHDKKFLEQLGYFGIVRPMMLEKLILIRNEVEHKDLPPPTHQDCVELLDFVWYFLRSTDGLLLYRYNAITLEGEDDSYWIGIQMDDIVGMQYRINGWICPSIISSTPTNGYLNIEVDILQNRRRAIERYINRLDGDDMQPCRCGRNSDDLYFHGNLKATIENIREIFKIYFLAHQWMT